MERHDGEMQLAVIECPHADLTQYNLLKCAMLPHLYLAGPSGATYPCPRCKPLWKDGQPPTSWEDNAVLRMYPRPPENAPPVDQHTAPEKAGWLDKIKSAGKAAIDFAAGGFRQVPAEVAAHRLAICEACEHYDAGMCKICGCVMSIKTKLPEVSCPLSPPKWDVVKLPGSGGCGSCPGG